MKTTRRLFPRQEQVIFVGTIARKEIKSGRSIGSAQDDWNMLGRRKVECEIEAKIGARKVPVEDAVTRNSGTDLHVTRDPSGKGKHQSEQELSFDWFTAQKNQNEGTSAIDASVSPRSNE